MKGVLLAGGTGSRLSPLTRVTNKHLLPVGQMPMIYWPILRILECGIEEIMIVTSPEHMGDVVNLLGSGNRFGADFTYRVQDKPGGIAQALALTERFVNNSNCMVMLGDNIFTHSLKDIVASYSGKGALVLLKDVDDPHRFGVAEIDAMTGAITRIVEKPFDPPSSYVVTGCYIYNNSVFGVIRKQEPSSRGEMEITDVNNVYIEYHQLCGVKVQGDWSDAGTFESLLRANVIVERAEFLSDCYKEW